MLLELHNVAVRFGGISALAGVSFRTGTSELMGVIGPNGAGKTTLFNVMSGIAQPTAGAFTFDGTDMTRRPAHAFNRLGIARTFQTARVFRNLTVRENVQFGLRFPWRRGGRAAAVGRETDALLFRLGLLDQADVPAGRLPPTRQRLLEIAMALATNPRLLLLDEVAAGLTQSETEAMAAQIRAIRQERDISIIWIEHNVVTLMRAVDRVMVLHHGEVLADGVPGEVAQNRAVIDAYLGEPETE
jgi:ABC-type branched-subunit amino acid transport system ATPase component